MPKMQRSDLCWGGPGPLLPPVPPPLTTTAYTLACICMEATQQKIAFMLALHVDKNHRGHQLGELELRWNYVLDKNNRIEIQGKPKLGYKRGSRRD